MKHIRNLAILSSLLFLIFSPGEAFAHGGFGNTLEKETDGYTAELEYDVPEIYEDELTSLLFYLDQDGETVAFDSLFVRIYHKEKENTVFSGNLAEDNLREGAGRVSVIFPTSGEYGVDLTYVDENKENLAQASFDLNVAPQEGKASLTTVKDVKSPLAFVGGLVLGFGSYKLIVGRKRSSKGKGKKKEK